MKLVIKTSLYYDARSEKHQIIHVTLPALISVCTPLRMPVVIPVFLCFGSQRKKNLTFYGPLVNIRITSREIK
jgi:hypothetical protein